MEIGRVKSFNSSLGYGFIKPDDGSADVIFHVSRIEVNDWEPGEGHVSPTRSARTRIP